MQRASRTPPCRSPFSRSGTAPRPVPAQPGNIVPVPAGKGCVPQASPRPLARHRTADPARTPPSAPFRDDDTSPFARRAICRLRTATRPQALFAPHQLRIFAQMSTAKANIPLTSSSTAPSVFPFRQQSEVAESRPQAACRRLRHTGDGGFSPAPSATLQGASRHAGARPQVTATTAPCRRHTPVFQAPGARSTSPPWHRRRGRTSPAQPDARAPGRSLNSSGRGRRTFLSPGPPAFS